MAKGPNYLGRVKGYTEHKRYQTGTLSQAQLEAYRRNLEKARLARGQRHVTGSTTYHGLRKVDPAARGNAAAARVYKMRDIEPNRKGRPIGVRYARYMVKYRFKKPRITGLRRRMSKRISPSRYLGRTGWGATRGYRVRKRLYRRSRRFRTQSRWKQRGKRFTPR